jgi:Domain of unknown function (DUF3846)
MALVITSRGTMRNVSPASGPAFTLPELQAIVGGYIEAVRVPGGGARLMFVNEEGKREGLPLNPIATRLVWPSLQFDDYIVGDVIVCSRIEAGEELE